MDASQEQLDFTWRLQPGAGDACHYGLLLAQAVGFPDGVCGSSNV